MKRIFLLILSLIFIICSIGCNKANNSNDEKGMVTLEKSFKLELPKELEKYREKFEKTIKPFIKITPKKGKTSAWESKFGGTPYLPLSFEYPKDSSGEPMRLLAQINFEEVPDIGLYPSKGILEFYISSKDDVYGINFDKATDQKNFRIIYIPDVTKDNSKILRDFSFLKESNEDYFPIAKEGRLEFKVSHAPVASEDYQFDRLFNVSSYKFFDDAGNGDELWDWYEKRYSSAGHKIGGYAYFTQSDPRESNYEDYKTLLLQIDTDDELGIMWGDCGVANFFIKPEDLKNLDFSRVLYNWDCC